VQRDRLEGSGWVAKDVGGLGEWMRCVRDAVCARGGGGDVLV
jgi:hypothetical protein